MDAAVLIATAIFVAVSYLLWRTTTQKQFRLPPGPRGNFLFGQTFENWLNTNYFGEKAKQYGEIFTLRVLGKNVIVVNSYEAVKEAFGYDWLSGRMRSPFDQYMTKGGHGIALSDGLLWRTHRRFALSVLRDFGLGRSKIETTIRDELQCLLVAIGEQKEKPFSPHRAYTSAVSNVMNSIVFNERCSEDPDFESIVDNVKTLSNVPQRPVSVLFLWPLLKHLPGDLAGLKLVDRIISNINCFVAKKFQEHKNTFDPSNIRDYIDAFLLESAGKDASHGFTEVQLCQSVFDLFFAGTETTSSTLLWATIFLAKHADVQRKMYEEIEQTIGDAKLPETADKVAMRYTDAVIYEVQRYATLVPLGLAHRATETGQVRGYDIPKDSIVMPDIWNIHRSTKLWKDPYSFNPQNFLDDKGNLINTNYMLSFSTGKRVCLGETLARQELFIFLTGLLQQFEFIEDPAHPLPGAEDFKPNSILRAPLDFVIIAKRRRVD